MWVLGRCILLAVLAREAVAREDDSDLQEDGTVGDDASKTPCAATVKQLNGRISKLQAEVEGKKAENKMLLATETGLHAKIKSLEAAANSKADEDKRKSTSESKLQTKVHSLEAEVTSKTSDNTKLSATVADLQAKVKELTSAASSQTADKDKIELELKERIKSLEIKDASKAKDNKQLSETVTELQDKITSLEAEARSRADNDAKTESELQGKLSSLEGEMTLRTADLKKMSGTISDLRAKLDMSEADLDSKAKENKRCSDQITTQEATISGLNMQVDESNRQNTKLKEDLASKEQKVSELSGKVKSMATRIAGLTSDVESKTGEISKLEGESQKQWGEILGLKMNVSNLESQSASQLKQLEEKSADIDAKTAEIKQKETDNSHLVEEVKSQTATVSGLREDAERQKNELSKISHKLQSCQLDFGTLTYKHNALEAKYADPSVQHFLQAKAVKVYHDPGIEGAANKTFIYVLPTLRQRYGQGKELLKEGEKAVYSKLNAYVGTDKTEAWLPAISGCLVYGAVIVPFACTVCCLTRIVCKMRLLLLFCHLDFLFTTLCAGIFAVWTGKEPLAAFAYYDPAVYLFTQLFFAVIFCVYGLMLLLAYSVSKGGTSEGCYRFSQILGAVPIGAIYYRHVWTPAMLDEMPHMDQVVEYLVGEGSAVSTYAWLPYLPVSVLFLILLRLERLSWHAAGAGNPKKAQEQISVTMRDDLELAALGAMITESPAAVKKE